MPTLVAVDSDPFATKTPAPKLTPVDGDPFAPISKTPSSTLAPPPAAPASSQAALAGGNSSFHLSFANGKPELVPGATPMTKAPTWQDKLHEVVQGLPSPTLGGIKQGFDEAVAGGKQMLQDGNQDPSYFGRAKQVGGLLGMAGAPIAGLARGAGEMAMGATNNPAIAGRVEDVAGFMVPGVPKGLGAPERAVAGAAERIEPSMSRAAEIPKFAEPLPAPKPGPKLTPVDHDPFAAKPEPASASALPKLTPVDHDPFDKIAEVIKSSEPSAPPKGTKPVLATTTPKADLAIQKADKELKNQNLAEPKTLPSDYASRMKRAAAMGFDTSKTFYHGTGQSFEAFDVGKGVNGEKAIFVTDKPEIAEKYGSGYQKQIIPLFARIENPMEVDAGGKEYSNPLMVKWINDAKTGGHDVLIVKNIADFGGLQTQWGFLKPENLRAKYGAQFDPAKKKSANMLSAAADDMPKELPERSASKYIQDTDDSLFRLRQASVADKAELAAAVKAMPKELKNPELQERLYAAGENDPEAVLTPEAKAAYDEYVAPWKQEEADLYDELRSGGLAEADIDPDGYMHRMLKGKTPEIDRLTGEGGDDANPTGGRSLSQRAPSQRERKYFALEDARGNRKTVAISDGKITVMNKEHSPTLQDVKIDPASQLDDIGPGAKVNVAGKTWEIKQAYTREIERDTDKRYHKSAVANTVRNVQRLRATARAVAEVKKLQSTPEWAKYTFAHNDPKAPAGYRTPAMPLFRDFKMDPKMAEVIDDFYGRVRDGDDWAGEAFEKASRFVTQSLFWTPLPHIRNQAWHWFTARGIENFTPAGARRFVLTMPEAIREVVTQGPKYQKMLREGSGLVYGGLANRDFYEGMLKELGHSIEKEPSKWGPIANFVGGPKKLLSMIYNGSSKALWSVSDMFLMQRTLELQMKGMSPRAAVKASEKHIPNYRVPSRIFGSRKMQQGLTNPAVMQFSRYHYGMFKSWAHVANDMLKGVKGDRKAAEEAVGHLIATAFLMTVVEPLMSYGIQKLTGNKDASYGPAGSTTLPRELWDVTMGDKSLAEAVSSTITLNPLVKEGAQQMFNKDFFTGRNISEPGDKSVGRKAVQKLGHAAGMVAPLGAANEAWKNKKGALGVFAEKGFGYRDPSPEQVQAKAKALRRQQAEARSHVKKPRNMVEELFR